MPDPITHPMTHPPTHPITHPPTHPPTHSITHPPTHPRTTRLFVYGTLRTGDVRWHLLEPYVAGPGSPDSATGQIFDTGLGYPAALFGANAPAPRREIRGETFTLLADAVDHCLHVLDVEEDTVDGLYRRVAITTIAGHTAWAYEYGDGLTLSPIESDDWFDR